MEHVHWWLAGLAFTLGMVLTSTLMVRPVEHQVLVKKSVRGSSAKSKPPTARKPAVKSGTKREESPTAKTKVATELLRSRSRLPGSPRRSRSRSPASRRRVFRWFRTRRTARARRALVPMAADRRGGW
ncbi:Conserved exported or membrane protein of uncharacterised function [Mycobacterium tuberculosis]|nr:Conserved exported or membrane protein of uncharacterised function [Mycobacterium tuberculosis]